MQKHTSKSGRIDWAKTVETMPPGLTVDEVAEQLGLSYSTTYDGAIRNGYRFRTRGYSKRRMFSPERDTLGYVSLRAQGIGAMEAIKAVQSQIKGREGAIEKAQRMVEAGHPPGVAAIYTGLTRAEVYQVINETVFQDSEGAGR